MHACTHTCTYMHVHAHTCTHHANDTLRSAVACGQSLTELEQLVEAEDVLADTEARATRVLCMQAHTHAHTCTYTHICIHIRMLRYAVKSFSKERLATASGRTMLRYLERERDLLRLMANTYRGGECRWVVHMVASGQVTRPHMHPSIPCIWVVVVTTAARAYMTYTHAHTHACMHAHRTLATCTW